MSVVLVVEDDPAILRGLQDNLRFERLDVLTAVDGEAGYCQAREKKPDLILLDITLPKMSGFDVCRKLRREGFNSPIIMLTAKGQEADKVLGFEVGADDYVTKPFSIRELLARVKVQLRHALAAESQPDRLQFDDVVVDFRRFEAHKSGVLLEMTRKEFGVLRRLAVRPGEVITRDELLNDVWGSENFPTDRTVDSHIALLRRKIEDDPAKPRRLLTVHRVGYKLVI